MGGDALYVSRDNGTNWTRLAFPSAAARAAPCTSPMRTMCYVGVATGASSGPQWNGSAWGALTALTTPRPAPCVSDLFVDPGNLNRIWATYSAGSAAAASSAPTTAARHWTDCSAGLPALPANAIEVDPWNANRVWVAIDLGVYQSLERRRELGRLLHLLPNCFIGDLSSIRTRVCCAPARATAACGRSR